MAVTIADMFGEVSKFKYSGGSPVIATMRHFVNGRRFAVISAPWSSGPIPYQGSFRATLYVQGAVGSAYAIDLCVDPVFVSAEQDAALDEAATLWVPIGSAVVPALPAPDVLKQSIEDVSPFLRVRQTSGASAFTVWAWQET